MAKRKITAFDHEVDTTNVAGVFKIKRITFPPPKACPKCHAKYFHYHCGSTLSGGQLADYASCINCGWDSIPRVDHNKAIASSAD